MLKELYSCTFFVKLTVANQSGTWTLWFSFQEKINGKVTWQCKTTLKLIFWVLYACNEWASYKALLKARGWGGCISGSMVCLRTDEGKQQQGTSIFLQPVLLQLSLCANLCCLSFPNATLKQREEICDVANVTLVWVGAALISAVQKYFCQLHIFPCWALHFCFAVHVASCPVEKPFSLQKHPPCWCLLEAFCATLGTPLVFSMAVEMHR